jgi:hypothetical protein
MRLLIAFLSLTVLTQTALAKVQAYCGWIDNPTPANFYLTDATASWIIGEQGGHQAEGDVSFPDSDDEFVKTNGSYGYFCGCLQAETSVQGEDHLITKIVSSQAQSLSACLGDSRLSQSYRPKTLIDSSGTTDTECNGDQEQEQVFKSQRICVDEAGKYHYLADTDE